jgi:hypothetical protein
LYSCLSCFNLVVLSRDWLIFLIDLLILEVNETVDFNTTSRHNAQKNIIDV